MSTAETVAYAGLLASARVVLEYGIGGSTMLALESQTDRIYSVESDPEWIAHLRGKPEVFEAEARQRLHFFHADIGPVGDWGMPVGPANPGWRNYPVAIWDRMRKPAPDLCFIDGRFRVACALTACLFQPHANRIVVIHDFWNRPHYHRLLRFLDVSAEVDSMGVFVLKPGLDREGASSLLRQSFADPR